MTEVKSKVSGETIHVVFRIDDFTNGRQEIVTPEHFIQCAALKLETGKTFRPHIHLWHDGSVRAIAQESWVVVSGRVEVFYYDIDTRFLESYILNPGDASFTLRGGHTYKILEDAVVYEFKTGPYLGQELDKKFI